MKERRERRVGGRATKGPFKAAPIAGTPFVCGYRTRKSQPLLRSSQRVLTRHLAKVP